MRQEILAVKEEHAEDMLDLLDRLNEASRTFTGPFSPPNPLGTDRPGDPSGRADSVETRV
jgi:hypothetical protein